MWFCIDNGCKPMVDNLDQSWRRIPTVPNPSGRSFRPLSAAMLIPLTMIGVAAVSAPIALAAVERVEVRSGFVSEAAALEPVSYAAGEQTGPVMCAVTALRGLGERLAGRLAEGEAESGSGGSGGEREG
jgi:hypothetical protein